MSARAWLGPTGPLGRAIAGYELRESQLAMADAVERALRDDGTLVVEAGTGTGKTLAYLVPAILSGRRVVVSTGTKTLQDQIMEHDLPLLERHMGVPLQATCMKGLANYLCLRRYHELLVSADADRSPSRHHLPILQAWRETTFTGDRAELTDIGEDASIWAAVQSGSDTRVGSRCSYFDDCFVTKMRQRAEASNLIIVNHHLFFADLAMRGPHHASVLPDYDAVIFDEAHQIEDVATAFFGVTVSTSRIEKLVRDAERALRHPEVDAGSAAPWPQQVLLAAQTFFAYLPRPASSESGRVSLPPEVFGDRLRDSMFALDNALDGLGAHAKRHAGHSDAIAHVVRRVAQVRDDIARVAEGGEAQVAWTEQRGRSVSIGASPVDVSEILRDRLFDTGTAVVLTSATLSTSGSFKYIRQRLGLEQEIEELILPSPFEYADQAALYVATQLPDPREPAFLTQAADTILSLIELTGGGAFVLCTSLRAMRELAASCRPRLGYPMRVQGEAPKAALLEWFREQGDAVLFATASFWQGIDVPGQALRLVIMDKLPFDVPTDPLILARCERIKAQGAQPFMQYLVPSAAITLKQGFGRLIRSRRDRGIVAILDRRLLLKGYGKAFLKSLPHAHRCETFEQVSAFWQGTTATEREPS